MRFTSQLAILVAVVAAPVLVVSIASADGQASGSVSGSATISVGTPPPPPAPPPAGTQPPPPPVVYQPGPPPQPYGYGAPPPPPPPPAPPPGDYLHDGFYLRFALGGGGFNAKGTYEPSVGFDNTISGGGLAMDLAIGGSPVPGVTIGGEYLFQQIVKPSVSVNGGPSQTADNNANFGLIGPFIDWYPNPEGGFHFGGTLGLAVLTVSDPTTGETKAADRGGGGALGIGYDFWVGRQLSLGILGKAYGGTVSHDAGNVTEKYTVSGGSLLFSILYQ